MATVSAGAGLLEGWLAPFLDALERAAQRRAVLLVAGALLALGRRNVASALRAAGLEHAPGFTGGYPQMLSERRWNGVAVA